MNELADADKATVDAGADQVVQVATTSTPAAPRPLRWSVSAYEAAIAKGVFAPTLRAELIAGEIVEQMPVGAPHAYTTRQLRVALAAATGNQGVLGVQDPIQLGEYTRPEPDVWIAAPPPERYATRVPRADEVLLVCEVADTSLEFDRSRKLVAYAQAGIPEYWILNLRACELERHTGPREDGSYAEKRAYAVGEVVDHGTLSGIEVAGLFAAV